MQYITDMLWIILFEIFLFPWQLWPTAALVNRGLLNSLRNSSAQMAFFHYCILFSTFLGLVFV